jgi:hypothetical protein
VEGTGKKQSVDLADGLAAVPLGHPEWGWAKADRIGTVVTSRLVRSDWIGTAVALRLVQADRIGIAVALRLVRCTAVTNSTVAIRSLVIRRCFIVYIAICADRASMRVDVASVCKIISYSAVWATSIIRLHMGSIASRVTMDILISGCWYVQKYKKESQKYYWKSFHREPSFEVLQPRGAP